MAAAAWVISFRRCLSAAFSNADATAKSSKQKVETLARMARTSTSTNRIRYRAQWYRTNAAAVCCALQ